MDDNSKIILGIIGAGALLYFAYPMLYPATVSDSKANKKPGAGLGNLFHNINERVITHGGGADPARLVSIKAEKMAQKEGYETNLSYDPAQEISAEEMMRITSEKDPNFGKNIKPMPPLTNALSFTGDEDHWQDFR